MSITIQEAKKLKISEISEKIASIKQQLFNLRIKKNYAPLEKPHLLKNLKKDIAVLSTAKTLKQKDKNEEAK